MYMYFVLSFQGKPPHRELNVFVESIWNDVIRAANNGINLPFACPSIHLEDGPEIGGCIVMVPEITFEARRHYLILDAVVAL